MDESRNNENFNDRIDKKSRLPLFVGIVVVIVALAAVWWWLEKEDVVGTDVISGYVDGQDSDVPEVSVNGVSVPSSDLVFGIEQQLQIAGSQGADINDEEVKNIVQTQAIDLLVNTELLQQAAKARGIIVSGEEVSARIVELEVDSGGAEVLDQRIEELGLNRKVFERDIKSEMVVLRLLEAVVAESPVVVTEEEVQAVYANAVNSGATVPPIEEVRSAIEAQIKEQKVIEAYITDLREAADIEIS